MTSTTPLPSSSPPPAPPAASPTPTGGGGGGGGGGGPTSSPLLFFVALGFGVVFTNLWIIVGVKYCFRYNQRNRRPQHDDNGEPIDMVAMPHGPRRRRREKKLMTMEEVNERFPLLKYKAWMTTRAEEGLPTAGGVAAPSASRAASLRNAEGTVTRKSGETQRPSTPAAKESMDQHDNTPESKKGEESEKTPGEPKPVPSESQGAQQEPKPTGAANLDRTRTHDTAEEDDDDDQIQSVIPTEMMATPGDSCAICIDTLEDDDDVRGLTCGHAFHASCLDPWLTSRRASCPLCKADYYVPKPRPEGEAQNDERSGRRRADMPQPPQDVFLGGRANRIRFMPARFMFLRNEGDTRVQHDADHPHPNRHNRNPPDASESSPAQDGQERPSGRRFVPSFSVPRPNIRVPNFMRRNAQPQNNATDSNGPETTSPTTTTTPGQLEAGQR